MYGILSDWPLGDVFLLFEGAAYAVGFTAGWMIRLNVLAALSAYIGGWVVSLLITFLFVGMAIPSGIFYVSGWFIGLALIALSIGSLIKSALGSSELTSRLTRINTR